MAHTNSIFAFCNAVSIQRFKIFRVLLDLLADSLRIPLLASLVPDSKLFFTREARIVKILVSLQLWDKFIIWATI